jgi:hypothetical protein
MNDSKALETSNVTASNVTVVNHDSEEITKFQNFVSVEDQLKYFQKLIKSGALPKSYNTPEKVLVGAQLCKELNIPTLNGLRNLPFIDGVPTPSAHLLQGLAMGAGVTFKILKDAEEYIMTYIDSTGATVPRTQMKDGVEVPMIDRITSIEVSKIDWAGYDRNKITPEQHIKLMEAGIITVIRNVISFRKSEAAAMGLLTRDNWKKMPYIMMLVRCKSLASRFAAPGATMGMMTVEEILDSKGVNYSVDDNGYIKGEELVDLNVMN